VDGRNDRAGIARQLVADAVANLAGHLVESDDAAAIAHHFAAVDLGRSRRAAADRHDQQLVLDDRRGADAEEVLDHPKGLGGVYVPDQTTIADPQATKPPLDAEGVDPVAVDQWTGARSVAVLVVVLVLHRVLGSPQFFAGLAVERSQAGARVTAIEQEEATVRDRRSGVAFARGDGPDQPGSVVAPLGEDAGFGRFVVAARPQKAWPILSRRPRDSALGRRHWVRQKDQTTCYQQEQDPIASRHGAPL